jgi:septal ring factor EnvC (AmiA/AmiB activator)
MDITLVLPWLSLALGVIAIYKFAESKKERAMQEGRRHQEIEQLRKDLTNAHDKIRDLEKETRCFDLDLAEVKGDVKHILLVLEKIEKRLENGSPH